MNSLTLEQARKTFGKFPELTDAENEEIHVARANGFAVFFPVFPDAETQAKNTLEAARTYSKSTYKKAK